MGHWNVQHITDVLNSLGWIGHIGGALLVLLQTLVPFIPFVVVAGVNVLLFGFWPGFIVNYVFACLGAVIAYFVAKNLGRAWVQSKLSKYSHLDKFNDRLKRHGIWFIVASRIIPVLPSFAINLGAAVMKVRTRHFIIGTLIGKAPMIFLESLIGHDLLHFGEHKGRLMILLIVFAVMLALGSYIKNRWTKAESPVNKV